MINLGEIKKGSDYRFISTDRHYKIGGKTPIVVVEGIVSSKLKTLYKLTAKGHMILADSENYGTVWYLER